jgi:hypothetical protein
MDPQPQRQGEYNGFVGVRHSEAGIVGVAKVLARLAVLKHPGGYFVDSDQD